MGACGCVQTIKQQPKKNGTKKTPVRGDIQVDLNTVNTIDNINPSEVKPDYLDASAIEDPTKIKDVDYRMSSLKVADQERFDKMLNERNNMSNPLQSEPDQSPVINNDPLKYEVYQDHDSNEVELQFENNNEDVVDSDDDERIMKRMATYFVEQAREPTTLNKRSSTFRMNDRIDNNLNTQDDEVLQQSEHLFTINQPDLQKDFKYDYNDVKTKKQPKEKGKFRTNPKQTNDPYADGEGLEDAQEIAGSSVAQPSFIQRSSLSSEGW